MFGQPRLNKFRNEIVSAAPVEEKPMETPDATENYKELDDGMVLYTRRLPVISGSGLVWYDVQVHLTTGYLKHTPADIIQSYLDRAVAAILIKNGIRDA